MWDNLLGGSVRITCILHHYHGFFVIIVAQMVRNTGVKIPQKLLFCGIRRYQQNLSGYHDLYDTLHRRLRTWLSWRGSFALRVPWLWKRRVLSYHICARWTSVILTVRSMPGNAITRFLFTGTLPRGQDKDHVREDVLIPSNIGIDPCLHRCIF